MKSNQTRTGRPGYLTVRRREEVPEPPRKPSEPASDIREARPDRPRARAHGGGVDSTDLAILRALNGNARKSYRDVAKELGIALTTVSNHVKRLEDGGVIRGYFPWMDPARLGFELTVIVGVKIHPGKLLDVQQRIARSPRVFAVYDVTGEWDSVVLARFKDRQELNDFIKDVGEIPHVERTTTQLVLNTVKDEKRVLL